MAISNYTELQAAIANWTGNSDLASGARAEELVTLAEARIYQEAASRGEIIGMDKVTTVSITSGVETVAVPSDYIRAIHFRLDDESELDQQSLSQLVMQSNVQDKPRFFATVGGASPLFYLRPIPDGNYTATLVYAAKFPALSSGSPTNWLLTNAPNVYLYASVLEASALKRDDAAAQGAQLLFDNAMTGLIRLTSKYRFSSPAVRSVDRSLSARLRERLF